MAKQNVYTGKKYKCKSLVEINEFNWNSKFKVGETYNELKNENLPLHILMLELKGENWKLIGIYVDSCQFELVRDEK